MLAGLMQHVPLTLNMVRERVAALYRGKSVTTLYASGVQVATYGDVIDRAAQLADFLREKGIGRGMRVASLAWNSQRHLELYLAIPCMGAVLHTINARLSPPEIAKLLAHAQDRILFADRSSWTAIGRVIQLPPSLHCVIVLEDEPADAAAGEWADVSVPRHAYEDVLCGRPTDFDWPMLGENEAAGLCYTSGTTGEPKGVLYSHRSATLHTFACLFADGIAMRERDVCMPAVPMFHANAWGFPYAALMVGASLALPCRHVDPASLADLIAAANVTMATAVPTVWSGFLDHIRANPSAAARIGSLKRLPIGGAAVSRALIDGFAEFGIEVMHCWGMTEISPLGLTNVVRSDLDEDTRHAVRTAQGLPIPGCALRIVDEKGERLPSDGKTPGELQVNSPWAASAFFDASSDAYRPDAAFIFAEGREWLRTGDVATIDPHGYVRIVDRTKDLIKSGGEWISSQALELQLLNHPEVREAAAVGRPDPKWQERPVACVCLHVDTAEKRARFKAEFAAYLVDFFPKWQIPDDVIFYDELPKGRTGKIDKQALKKQVADTRPDSA